MYLHAALTVMFISFPIFLFSDGPELDCPSSYTAVEHVPHSLRCNVSGFPQPEVIWYKEEEELPELPENLTRRDAGQYTAIATTSSLSVNATVEITVICKSY